MDTRDDSTTVTYCLMATHSSTATAPTSVPEPLPLLERARWSVAGGARTYCWAPAPRR